jgi:hypothetical protein
VLVVLDPTSNSKLAELEKRFHENGGKVFIGNAAWKHLDDEAGPTMAKFLENYVRRPINDLLQAVPAEMPEMTLAMAANHFTVRIGSETFSIERRPDAPIDESEVIPDDVEEQMPGV